MVMYETLENIFSLGGELQFLTYQLYISFGCRSRNETPFCWTNTS